MEFKPSTDKQKLDGFGRPLGKADTKNPFAAIAKGLGPAGQKRRRFAADTIGATPPRDGAFAPMAADVAVAKPPRTRARQQRIANPPGLGLARGQRLR
jgi:hypothetical protein